MNDFPTGLTNLDYSTQCKKSNHPLGEGVILNFKRPEQGLLSMDHELQRTTGLSPTTAQVCVNPKGLQGEVTRNPAGFWFFLPQGFSWTTLLRFWSYHASSSCPSSTLFSGIPMIPLLGRVDQQKIGMRAQSWPMAKGRQACWFFHSWLSIPPPAKWYSTSKFLREPLDREI